MSTLTKRKAMIDDDEDGNIQPLKHQRFSSGAAAATIVSASASNVRPMTSDLLCGLSGEDNIGSDVLHDVIILLRAEVNAEKERNSVLLKKYNDATLKQEKELKHLNMALQIVHDDAADVKRQLKVAQELGGKTEERANLAITRANHAEAALAACEQQLVDTRKHADHLIDQGEERAEKAEAAAAEAQSQVETLMFDLRSIQDSATKALSPDQNPSTGSPTNSEAITGHDEATIGHEGASSNTDSDASDEDEGESAATAESNNSEPDRLDQFRDIYQDTKWATEDVWDALQDRIERRLARSERGIAFLATIDHYGLLSHFLFNVSDQQDGDEPVHRDHPELTTQEFGWACRIHRIIGYDGFQNRELLSFLRAVNDANDESDLSRCALETWGQFLLHLERLADNLQNEVEQHGEMAVGLAGHAD